MTPANWVPCEPIILPPPQTFQELQKRMEEKKKKEAELIGIWVSNNQVIVNG